MMCCRCVVGCSSSSRSSSSFKHIVRVMLMLPNTKAAQNETIKQLMWWFQPRCVFTMLCAKTAKHTAAAAAHLCTCFVNKVGEHHNARVPAQNLQRQQRHSRGSVH
jgi:hypothetical protein